MKLLKVFIMAALMLVCANSSAQAELEAGPIPAPNVNINALERSASNALMTFSSLVNSANYAQMGFKSVDEVKRATLGDPVFDYIVPLDRLKGYRGDVKEMLTPSNTAVVPVRVDSEARSSISMTLAKGEWKAASFGKMNFTRLVEAAKRDIKRDTRTEHRYFIVRVPALNLYFLGYMDANAIMLAPLLNSPNYGFKAGVAMNAEKVFDAIHADAKEHNGLPR